MCRRNQASFDAATPAEVRALRRAVEPVYRDLERDPRTRASIHAIESLKRDVAAPPAVVPGCRASQTPRGGATTKLDGVWTMDTDRSAAAPEYFPENWGHWVFVFDRGRFAITQENKPSCTWGSGSSPSTATGRRGRSRTAAASPRAARRTSRASSSLRHQRLSRHAQAHPGEGPDLAEELPRQALAPSVRDADAAVLQQALSAAGGRAPRLASAR